jgi:hypothetical protein
MSLLCYLKGHARSRGRVRYDRGAGRWTSKCRRCSVPMTREQWPGEGWHAVPAASEDLALSVTAPTPWDWPIPCEQK